MSQFEFLDIGFVKKILKDINTFILFYRHK